MSTSEFDQVTALAHVRSIGRTLAELDMFVGVDVTEQEFQDMRKTIRRWETGIQAGLNVRKARNTAE